MGFDVRTLDLTDIVRAGKQSVELTQGSEVTDSEHPLVGVTRSQRTRNQNVADVLNIGAGTRCTHCGFLHFLWRQTCGSCDKPMEYNLGHRDEENRM